MIKDYLLLLLTFTFINLNAQTIITDRPDQTESSSTIEKNSIQIESGLLVGFTEEGLQKERQILAPTTLFRIGITNGIELRMLSQFESFKDQTSDLIERGISDLEIGTKIQLVQQEGINREIAFLTHLIVPTGSTALSGGKFGVINKLSIAHQINDQIGLGYNLGYNYFGTGKGDLTYSLAIGFGLTDKASVYIEPYGDLAEFDTL